MTFTTVVSLAFAVKTSITEIYTREFTHDSFIPTVRTDLIPHAANKYSKARLPHFLSEMTATKSRRLTDTTVVYDFTTVVLWMQRKLHPSSRYSSC